MSETPHTSTRPPDVFTGLGDIMAAEHVSRPLKHTVTPPPAAVTVLPLPDVPVAVVIEPQVVVQSPIPQQVAEESPTVVPTEQHSELSVAPESRSAMSDSTTTSPIVGDHVHGYNDRRDDRRDDSGRVADHAVFQSLTTPKDVIADLSVINNRQGDSFAAVQQSIADAKAIIGDRVDGSAFRTLEQFGILGVQGQKLAAASDVQGQRLAAATDVLVQKTTGELSTAVTLAAKDSIIDSGKNTSALFLQAEKIASASVLQAVKDAHETALAIGEASEEIREDIAQAAKEAALCCCSTKAMILEQAGITRGLIRDDGDRTRALIDTIERTRQAVELVDTKTELASAKQTEVLRGVLANLVIGVGK